MTPKPPSPSFCGSLKRQVVVPGPSENYTIRDGRAFSATWASKQLLALASRLDGGPKLGIAEAKAIQETGAFGARRFFECRKKDRRLHLNSGIRREIADAAFT